MSNVAATSPTSAMTRKDVIEQQMASIEAADAAAFDSAFAALPEAQRQRQKPREGKRGQLTRLYRTNDAYRNLADELSTLTTAGPTSLNKAEREGAVLAVAEVDKRAHDLAVEIHKSDPTKDFAAVLASVWEADDRALWRLRDSVSRGV